MIWPSGFKTPLAGNNAVDEFSEPTLNQQNLPVYVEFVHICVVFRY